MTTSTRADHLMTSPSRPPTVAPVVRTTSGRVRGVWREGSAAFLGIPFAAAPAGANRFLLPQPPKSWDGVREATRYGATPQRQPFGPKTTIPEPSIAGTETLNVNVFTPAPGQAGNGLPVLVWIHGGGYFAGSPASPWYDGRSFNRDGVVTVSISYRLGFDGFGLIDGAPTNRAIRDQIAALEWVQQNIAAFGGDPARVTIAGQSAGAGSVLTLMSCPRADGLFAGAISQSGALSTMRTERAREVSDQLARDLGLQRPTLRDWQGVNEAALLEHERKILDATLLRSAPTGAAQRISTMLDPEADHLGLPFAPIVDDELVLTFSEAAQRSAADAVPLLLGSTTNEFVLPSDPNSSSADVEDQASALLAAGASPSSVEHFRQVATRLGPDFAANQIQTEAMFRVPAARISHLRAASGAGERTWLYDFRYVPSGARACEHCFELPFTWDLLEALGAAEVVGEDAPVQIAKEMHGDWVRFVTEGSCAWPSSRDRLAGAKAYGRDSGYDHWAYQLEAELVGDSTP